MDAKSNPSSGLKHALWRDSSRVLYYILAGYGCFIYATTIANLTENLRLLLFWLVMAAFIAIFFLRTPGVCGGGGYVLILL